MDFGSASNIGRIKFDMPQDDAATLEYFSKRLLKSITPIKIKVGAPVWTPKEWVGRIYPPKTKSQDYLHHYSRQFSSIELNSTFYSLPEATQVTNWKNAVPQGFRFCPKFPQDLSRNLDHASDALIDLTFKTMKGFADTLGLSFLQMPPQFEPRDLHALRTFLRRKPRDFALAIEVRNEKFFTRHTLIPEMTELLEEFEIASVITDVSGRRDVLHTSLRSPQVMIRFKGNELHPTDYTRIDDWVRKIGGWAQMGVREIYFFIHHETFLNVPELAIDLIKKLNIQLSLGIIEPKWIKPEAEPQLKLF